MSVCPWIGKNTAFWWVERLAIRHLWRSLLGSSLTCTWEMAQYYLLTYDACEHTPFLAPLLLKTVENMVTRFERCQAESAYEHWNDLMFTTFRHVPHIYRWGPWNRLRGLRLDSIAGGLRVPAPGLPFEATGFGLLLHQESWVIFVWMKEFWQSIMSQMTNVVRANPLMDSVCKNFCYHGSFCCFRSSSGTVSNDDWIWSDLQNVTVKNHLKCFFRGLLCGCCCTCLHLDNMLLASSHFKIHVGVDQFPANDDFVGSHQLSHNFLTVSQFIQWLLHRNAIKHDCCTAHTVYQWTMPTCQCHSTEPPWWPSPCRHLQLRSCCLWSGGWCLS